MSVWRAFLAATVLVAALVLPLESRAAKEHHTCNEKGSHTIVRDRVARVYRVGPWDERTVVGCLLRTGHETVLGTGYRESPYGNVGVATRPVALRGHWAAAAEVDHERDGTTTSDVSVRDLRSGERRHFWHFGGYCGNETDITALRVSASGSAAWIAQIGSDCHDNLGWHVLKADGRGRRSVQWLDDDDDIDPHYLKLRHGVLTWKNGGATRTARVRP
jgi:hypothetical protein